MADKVQSADDARAQFWSELDDGRVSMLWVTGSDQHPQPMTHFVDQPAGAIWYITSAETDLAQAVGSGVPAQLVYMASGQDYQASVTGRLDMVADDAKLDALWNVAVAAWFEGGRADPNVRLLRFVPDEAAIWASEASGILVGLKILRAGMQEGAGEPDVGVHKVVRFRHAA